MAFAGRGPGIWTFRVLLLALLCLGYIKAESEKEDFEFAGEKDSFKDDEDFLADEAGSGEIEGSGAPAPTGKPALYRVVLNITSLQYTAAIAAAGRNIENLPETQQVLFALQKLFAALQGTINIRIVDLQPGSLMVTFDLATDGSQTEEEVQKLLRETLQSGSLNGLAVSPTGYDFKTIRDTYVCPPAIGRIPSALPQSGTTWANLMINNAFVCTGFIISWNYFRASSIGSAYIGVFRQTSDTEFMLISSALIPEATIGFHSLQLPSPVLVQKGDFVGIYYDWSAQNLPSGVFAMATSDDNVVPENELYQNYYVRMFQSDMEVGVPFQISNFEYSENSATFAVQAEMSYLNVPEVTEAPRPACGADEWTCRNGDCIPADYYCDRQADCYDGSDEENCVQDCGPGEVRCGTSAQCIPEDFVCNGVDDCGDNWDEEQNCFTRPPDPVTFVFRSQDSEFPDSFVISWSRPFEIRSVVSYLIRYRKVNVQPTLRRGRYALASAAGEYSEVDLPGTEESYELRNLQPDTHYEVEIYARNERGTSQPGTFIFKTARTACAEGQFQCGNGNCIESGQYCDGFPDCSDSSDEPPGCIEVPTCVEGQVTCKQPDGTYVCADKAMGCECALGEFQCADGRQCISGERRCDNRQDCDDKSDENNCPCPSGSFQCSRSDIQECVDQLLVCDGRSDCSDGSDEANCGCRDDQWQCSDGSCIPSSMRCDKVPQCEDSSDEVGCRVECRADQYTCADGNCVEGNMRCDGTPQCEDSSDEDGCIVTCSPDQFTCQDGNCVQGRMRCDGVPQCEDGSDEFDCACPDGMFTCNDRNCVEGNMRCDGVPQCEDGSDEFNCPSRQSCPTGDFQCLTTANLECIDVRLKCDGYPDCSDNSDELDCPGCKADEVQCDNRCLPAWTRCNGRAECRDRSDELNCACTDDQFRCGDGLCIDISRRCDRRDDCADRSDELACPCRAGEFQCVNGDCIDERRKCDQRVDCRDGSDETDCDRRRQCNEGYKPCGTGHCLSNRRWCDGYPDCPDSSDEVNCTLTCGEGEFPCEVDRKCIPPEQICNRVYDCSDRSDEPPNCRRCRDDEFECESDKSCISLVGRCNTVKECPDGSDEMGCPTRPPISVVVGPKNLRIRAGAEAIITCFASGLPRGASTQWIRRGGELPMQSAVEGAKLMIPVAKPMDSGTYICRVVGVPGEYSDAAVLEVVQIGPQENRTCDRDEAVCQNGQCIRREYRCDGERDCEDGSDEPADCYNNICEPNEFQCPSGQCVMKIWRCDGENDCPDGYDEQNCLPTRPGAACSMDEFQCSSGEQCVPLAYQCDHEIDCLDRSDEIGCAPPVITVPPVAEIEVELGSTFTIICEAVGVPVPLIVWRLNWGNIPTGDRVTVTSTDGRGQLTIADARYTDAGAYTCEAINNRGSIFAIPDALVIVRRQKGPCSPPFYNLGANTVDECVRCFCFGHSVQCFSSDLHVSRIALGNEVQFVRRDQDEITPVDQSYVNFKPSTREYQVLDMTRALPQGRYYWRLPQEFLGDRLTSYGGEIKYTIFYDIIGRQQSTTDGADVVISGNGITLYYKARTVPSPGVPTSISVPLIETSWERSEGTRRGDTPVSQYADRSDLMMVLEDLQYVLIRGSYDRGQTTSRIGGVFMTTAVSYETDLGLAYLVEDCVCPTGYTGLSCQECAAGFTRVQTGGYLGECIACNCNGHSNDCDPFTGACLNCQHNTEGDRCQLCQNGYFGDARGGTPNDCLPCPCPLTQAPNQFSRTCYLDTDRDVTCGNCPVGYEGRRCERCSEGYKGNPMSVGSRCVKIDVEDYCDPRGSTSPQPNPFTRRCPCKENVQGQLCDECKQDTFYLSNDYELGCVRCFCMGVSRTCQSTSWNRAQVGTTFTTDAAGFSITDMNGNPVENQRFSVDSGNRELVYRLNAAADDTLYWSLPSRFLGDKVTAYGGSLRFSVRYSSRQSAAIDSSEPLVKLAGNDITLVHRTRQIISPNRANPFSVQLYEQNWIRLDGQPATREHLLMVLADLVSIQIRAIFEESQADSGLKDVTLDIAEDRQTRQDRAFAVEQCVCPVGYRGLSCEDCDTGYTRSGGGLYLGLCEPCQCNGHSGECDPETGVCRNCQHNTEGDSCERCAVGYYGDATRGTRNDCQKCPCPLTEPPNQFSPACILDRDGQVTCTACPVGHTGRKCETCISGYTGNPLKVGDYCRLDSGPNCDCDTRGTVPNTQCDEASGQCQCKPYVQGLRCARCREGHFYLEADNPQGCLTCFCSGITNQCTSSNYYRDTLRPQLGADGRHNFVLMNRRMNSIVEDGFYVDGARNQITFNRFEGVQREQESLFFQLPPKFRGDQVASYGGYLRFTLEYTAQPAGRAYRDVDVEIISQGQALRLYHLFEPALQEGRTQTYEILLREGSFSYLNTAPTRETFMTILSNIEGFLIRATYNQQMNSVTLRDLSLDKAVPTPTNLGGAPMVEDCRCPEGYTGLSCQRCAQGYLRVSDGRGGLGRCVRCNCNNHASSCDPDSGVCLECQHNTEGDRCERCASGYYGDPTSGTPNDCRLCPCPLTVPSNQFSRTCFLDQDNLVTCDRCPTGYTGRNCERCDTGYIGNPSQPGDTCRLEIDFPRPNVTVSPIRVEEPLGSTVVFKCSVTAQGSTEVVWSRLDSSRLPIRASTSPTYDLRITDLRRDDSGRYVCTAINAYGVSRGVVELKVTVGDQPLQVRIDEPRIETDEGRTVRFTCTAVGASRDRTYILSWSKQGGLMPAKAIDQNGVLLIPNVQQRDAGNYVCVGSDMFSMAEAIAVLVVNTGPEPEPKVRIEPRYQTVDEGTRVKFECIATGDPTPTIKWRRGSNRPLNPEAQVTPDGLLIIPSVRRTDESDYFCEASNEAGTVEIRTILYVTPVERPEITVIVRKSAVFVDVGDTARLECYAEDGSGRITLFWSRSSGLPPGSVQDSGVLTIPNVQPSYAGNYVCTGTDTDTGIISRAVTVLEVKVEEITEPPTASVEPEKITIPMGTTGTLRCAVTGKPEPKITWLKSREELSSNHQVNGNVLRITQAQMEDRGIYVCRAENVAGVDQDWAIVEVERRMKPKIDIYPETTQRVAVGGSALFQCRVMDGDPPPTVQWTRVGGTAMSDKIELMDNGVIMFKQVTQSEQGGYLCSATNDMGTITATATLIVEGPPTITLQPSKVVYALVGQRVTLECTGEGDPIPSVYWIQPTQPRRGDVLPETSVFDSIELGSAVLDLASVDRGDEGYYTCVASNSGGRTEESLQLLIRENENVGVSISGPSTVSAVEGQDIELICTANAIRNPTIRWSRREGILPPGHSQRNGILNLPRFRSEYQGEYVCTTRTTQNVYEASVFIIVTVAPRLTISPQQISTRAGDTVQLRCTASGSGPFNIEWSKVAGQMNPRATERNGVLEIRQVTAADAGQYRCVVNNNAGSSEGFANVIVEVPPSVAVAQREVSVEPGRNVELRCDVTGSPQPVVRWVKENGELPERTSTRVNGVLTIYNVRPEDQGRYICTASSTAGSARDYTVLYVRDGGSIGQPNGNVDTQVVNVGDRVSMECIVTGTPLPTITWDRDDGELPKDAILGEGILIIPQARIEDAGTYTCLAVNEAGSISSKVILYVRAQPLLQAPATASAALGDRVSLVCDASGYPSPEITWYRKDGEMPDDYTIVDGDLVITRVRSEDAGTYVCHAKNEYGTSDTPVNLNVGALVPYFSQNPRSYMAFAPLNDSYIDVDLELSLRPESTEGLVLYNGQYQDGGGDFLCFGLKEGFPEFRFDVGSGPAIIRGNEKLDLNKWNTIHLKRNMKKGTMIVNQQPAYTGESPGHFTGLDLQENMYLGGVPNYDNIPIMTNFREGFVGSISEMKVKGTDLNLGAEALDIVGVEPYNTCQSRPCVNGGSCMAANTRYGFQCLCPQGYTGSRCEEVGERCYPGACGPKGRCLNLAGQTGFRCICPFGKTGTGCRADVLVINPFFNKTSFISYPPTENALFTLNLYTEFKPRSLSDGIIMYEGNNKDGSGDYMALVLKDGYLEFRFDTGSGPTVVRSRNPVRVNEWVRVKINRKNREATLIVNEDQPATESSSGSTIGLNLKLPLYLGGSDPTSTVAPGVGVTAGFVGCVAELQVNDRRVDLKNDALEFYNVIDCGERRLCERKPCKNGAVCEDLPGPDYRCLCGGSHTGKNCETEINICLTNSPCQNGAPCSMTNEGYRCDCPLGYAGDMCQLEVDLKTRLSFSGDSFIEFNKGLLPHSNTQERQTLSFTMTTTQSDGIILWQGEPGGRPLRGGDHFSIGLKNGYIEYSYEMGSGPASIMSRSRVDDGVSHVVSVTRLGRTGSLTVDGEEPVDGESQGFLQMLNADGNIFLGGVSIPEAMTDSKYSKNFIGCLENIVIHGKGPLQPVDAVQGYNVEECSP